jgi:methylated-DNA-protein-cysteine methyltransferase-like protein
MDSVTDRIIEIVESIPPGRVMTYGNVARAAGTGARVVGRVLHNGGHEIPWWRVVDADGRPYEAAKEYARAHFLEERTPLRLDRASTVVDLANALWGADDAYDS